MILIHQTFRIKLFLEGTTITHLYDLSWHSNSKDEKVYLCHDKKYQFEKRGSGISAMLK